MTPRLSLCIPTCNRSALLQDALESALSELATVPQGQVELLVSDNGSTDGTEALVAAFRERCPGLRYFRHPGNLGFDANYLTCVDQARGDYVWVMGDDDAWMPGAVERILRELEAGPDAVLFPAMECGLGMERLGPRDWFEDAGRTREVWRLDTREDLAAYLGALRYQAGIFAFISAAVIRRERFRAALDTCREAGMGYHYIHVWGMVQFLRSPATLHCLREPLVLNRTGNDPAADLDPWARGISDLRAWRAIGDHLLADDPQVRSAFMGVLRRNHQDIMVRRMRIGAGNDPERWREARELLLAVGFDPLWVDAADFLYRFYILDIFLSPQLKTPGLCLADLPLAALGARRAAVLAPGGAAGLAGASSLLGALKASGRFERILVVCDPGGTELLEGFEVLIVDPLPFAGDPAYRERTLARLLDFRPGLLVNADRSRGVAGDLLAARVQAPAGLAFQGRADGLTDELHRMLCRAYALQLAPDAPPEALASALGLIPEAPRLWPQAACREEAAGLFRDAGWDPERTLVLLGDEAAVLEDLTLPGLLARRVERGWTVLGVGGRESYAALGRLLEPLGERAMNLGGSLSSGTLAALLRTCGARMGGGPLEALAAGCPEVNPA